MTARWSGAGLAELRFAGTPGGNESAKTSAKSPRARALARALEGYFRTGLLAYDEPVDMSSGTDFDRIVWRALRGIPSGRTIAYGELARSIGRPDAARAVGGACGRNPVAIVTPCHRIVAGGGGLGGYAGGVSVKARLLELERAR